MKFLKFLIVVFLFCCSSSKVMTDYDKTIDLSKFKSYNFYEDIGKGLNELDVKRVTSALDSVLISSGFKKQDTSDFLINVIVNYSELQTTNTINIGFGNGGIGVGGGIPIGGKKINEELIVEFVNAKTNTLFWEGVLNSKVPEKRKPETKTNHYKKVIQQILNEYPVLKKTSK